MYCVTLQAFRLDIRLPQYLLMTLGWYIDSWWTVDDESLNCTVEERESVLPSSLAVLNTFFLDEINDVNLTTTVGIVSFIN